MRVEVAVMGPGCTSAPNGVYLREAAGRYGDSFYRSGTTNHAGREWLKVNGGQFHVVDIPDWEDPKQQGVEKLEALAKTLDNNWLDGYAARVRGAVDLIKKGNA